MLDLGKTIQALREQKGKTTKNRRNPVFTRILRLLLFMGATGLEPVIDSAFMRFVAISCAFV